MSGWASSRDLGAEGWKKFQKQCQEESETDVRHLGRYLTFEYDCPSCGKQEVNLEPDYPYCGAASTWTCKHCAGIMKLISSVPTRGTPKQANVTLIRSST